MAYEDNKDDIDEKALDMSQTDNSESITFSDKIIQVSSDDIPYGIYNIKSVNSGKFLNISGGGRDKRTNVQIWDNPQSWDSQWIIDNIGDGKYVIRSTNSGLFVNVKGGSTKDRANVHTWDESNNDSQWLFNNIDKNNGIYTIKNVSASKYLNCAGGDKKRGTNVWTWNDGNKASQWQLYCLLLSIS